MQFVADLHLHSKYSRAVSKDMVLPIMAAWASKKGIDILATGDWTHPLWLREIRGQLEEASEGLFKLKAQSEKLKTTTQNSKLKEPLFLLSVEVASIYSQGGRLRRIHNLIFAPSFEVAEKISKELTRRGVNLMADGRPMMGISSINLMELVLSIDKQSLLIPCHAWTPWFSLYGSNSGFDSIDECFGDYAKHIYAIETGLSSDPEMNWRISELGNRSILSFSDAHSPAKMGREATVFELEEPTYENIRKAIMGQSLSGYGNEVRIVQGSRETSPNAETGIVTDKRSTVPHIIYTIEFYPEEGKYHYTGHRNCKVVQTPEETKTKGSLCPVCHRQLTVGVMHRVEELSGMSNVPPMADQMSNDQYGVRWIEDPTGKHPKFVKLVPLLEVIAEALSSTVISGKVRETFERLIETFGSEIAVLLKTDTQVIGKVAGPRVAEGVAKVRSGEIVIHPGFDGEYGKVKIWGSSDGEMRGTERALKEGAQLGLEF